MIFFSDPRIEESIQEGLHSGEKTKQAEAIEAMQESETHSEQLASTLEMKYMRPNEEEAFDEGVLAELLDPDYKPSFTANVLYSIGILGLKNLAPQVEALAKHPNTEVQTAVALSLYNLGVTSSLTKEAEAMAHEIQTILFLKSISIFSDLSSEDLRRLAGVAHEYTYEEGERLVNEGDIGASLFLILSGSVSITRGSDDDATTLAILGEREFFGEMSIFEAERRSASVTASTTTKALILKSADINHLLLQQPQIGLAFLRTLCQRLREANQKSLASTT